LGGCHFDILCSAKETTTKFIYFETPGAIQIFRFSNGVVPTTVPTLKVCTAAKLALLRVRNLKGKVIKATG
jgi:hypothetical protein